MTKVCSKCNVEKDVSEFIRAKNCAPYNLHMTAIADKASTPFVSQVIVRTTNCNKFQKDAEIKSILSDRAFTRRIDVGLKCVVSQQYAIDEVASPGELS